MDISKIDRNLAVAHNVAREGAVFYDCTEHPFSVFGVEKREGVFSRMPGAVAAAVSENVKILNLNTAGGRVRFSTDSPYVIIKMRLTDVCRMSHMAFSGIFGADMYVDCGEGDKYCHTFIPRGDIESQGYVEGVCDFETAGMRTVTINMPLYNGVSDLYIGVHKDSKLCEAPKYDIEKPIVYYGSSITQGGCASRPGMSYQALLSRWLSADHINLGFSGSAKGEQAMAEYIATLDMSVFVMDYDHNATTADDLLRTHKPFFDIIRAKNPELPILLMSRPWLNKYAERDRRFEIIKATYESAHSSGDKNVYFIDGAELFSSDIGIEGTVDGCHPTDLGFFSMAKRVYPVLKEILKK